MTFRWGAAMVVLSCLNVAEAGDVQLLDPSIFGRRTSEPIKPLFDLKAGQTAPAYVQLDLLCGRYRAATVTYPEGAPYSDVSASLTRLYGVGETAGRKDSPALPWLWRVLDAEGWPLAIQLIKSGEGSDCVRVIYVRNAAWIRDCETGIPKQ